LLGKQCKIASQALNLETGEIASLASLRARDKADLNLATPADDEACKDTCPH
jgi:hypothetical protein